MYSNKYGRYIKLLNTDHPLNFFGIDEAALIMDEDWD